MNRSTPGLPVHHHLLEFTQTHVHRVGDAIQPSHPLSSPSPPSSKPSQHQSFPVSQLFPWGGQSYWSFSFSISPSNEHPGLISFRMDWLDLLDIQGTLKSLLQCHNVNAVRCDHNVVVLARMSLIWRTVWQSVSELLFRCYISCL